MNPLFQKIEFAATRDGFGQGLLTAAARNKNIVVVTADLADSTRVLEFQKLYPDRFFEVGVAEQNLVTVAAGLAAAGKIPFVTSYAVFSPGRNWEQIRTTICYNNVPVKIVGSHAGLSVGPDGATHQALEDIALMRTLPNMTVVSPADAPEAARATEAIAGTNGPSYLRLDREKGPVITREDAQFVLGKADIITQGLDVTIVSTGPLLFEVLQALPELINKKISAEIINLHTIKPLDRETILQSIKKTRAVVTVEDHQIAGGMGGATAELIAQEFPVPQEFVGVHDTFGESGTPQELIEKYGLSKKYIVAAVERVLKRKHSA